MRFKRVFKIENLYKVINPLRFKYYVIFKGYEELSLQKHILNGVYKVFVKRSSQHISIVKIPKKDSYFSTMLVKAIKKEDDFIIFEDTLLSLNNKDFLSRHIVSVLNVYRCGGYESKFIQGFNLVDINLGSVELDSITVTKIADSIDDLITSLENYLLLFGSIEGDWDMQNLLYDVEEQKIVNVDLEGFFMYKNGEKETQINFIKEKLLGLKNKLINLN